MRDLRKALSRPVRLMPHGNGGIMVSMPKGALGACGIGGTAHVWREGNTIVIAGRSNGIDSVEVRLVSGQKVPIPAAMAAPGIMVDRVLNTTRKAIVLLPSAGL